MGKAELLSFVIPCYRSADILPGVVRRIEESMRAAGRAYEVILVNDCSPDNTYAVIHSLCERDARIRGISLSRNFGQHAALMAGLRHAAGDVVVCMDDDGQTPPEEAHKLVEQIEAGHDVAMARYTEKKHGAFRNFGSRVNNSMARAMIGKPRELFLSSYVAMKRYIVREICSYTFPYPYISGLLLRATRDIVNVDVEHHARQSGKSGYTLGKLLGLWFNGFTNFSIKPLRVAIVLGVIIAVAGFALGLYAVVMRFVRPETLLGWPSMIAAVTLIGGIVLIVLGLIGEYVGRIYMGLNQQPQYVVKDSINLGDTHKK